MVVVVPVKTPKVPNTISDKKMRSLQERARKNQKDMFSKQAVRQRLASNANYKKRGMS